MAAFVPSSATVLRGAPVARPSATSPLRAPAAPAVGPRMGYGDYSILTDETKAPVGNYYADKFRRASDFTRGVALTDASAMYGRSAKGAIVVPKQGVPQELDEGLARIDGAPDDPRVAEADGAVWSWDANYDNPNYKGMTEADQESAEEAAFASFRAACATDRAATLAASDRVTDATVAKLAGDLSEGFKLTLEGQHAVEYARLQKIKNHPMTAGVEGKPQTEVPGTAYLASIGAADFEGKKGTYPASAIIVGKEQGDGAFWNTPVVEAAQPDRSTEGFKMIQRGEKGGIVVSFDE
ncbi:hypothetical protein BU14_2132s0001 [Porphyra umbilicalis]|uniref:Uncharacterized protein n=1 Tax=Porphyra umbilicalis TaxID=2786 RepID=A0A1X6NJT7_PORUM|nr:hypothetical protein BU14_2132s0001 [Porphyra umbilicalis]|eukprot:OSX68881.1 hypothetical protein BU14_2132s0001 [Porphyra umbilicalis]